MRYLPFTVLAFLLAGQLSMAWGANKQEKRLIRASEVFQEIMDTPDKGIPKDLLARAACIGIIPSVKKFAFGFGGRHGAGYVLCRKNLGKGPWGPPSGFSMSGGSFGLQWGFSATDYVLLFMNLGGVEKLLGNKFTLGADASVSFGPVGRTVEAATDAQMSAKILGYSRSKGLFAGLALDGAVLKPSAGDNQSLYGRKISARELLLEGEIAPPASAEPLLQTLIQHSSWQTQTAPTVAKVTAIAQPAAVIQATTGTISGTISDSTGAVVPDAIITIRNVETGMSRTVATDPAGRYAAFQLEPGSYEGTAAAAGFQTVVRRQITLTDGHEAIMDITL